MIVLVSMRIAENPDYPETRDAVSHDWGRLFGELGIVPVLVPNSLPDPSVFLRDLPTRGLLLTGGGDVGRAPGELDGPPASPRDATEQSLLAGAIQRGLPVFGVCRGLQIVNRHFDGSIKRGLPESHVAQDHEVEVVAPRAGLVPGEKLTVNSYHNDGVMADGVGAGLVPFAVTAGGVVEGLAHRHLPITAIQWHPERANRQARAADRALLGEWLERCA